ncbi:MAG: HEAT repeat domain-containing protein [Planctomycetota bacterium]|jgi:HEAT repeat protein
MGCEEHQEKLSALIDEELSPREATEVRTHLTVCGECRERFDGLDRAAGAVSLLDDAGPLGPGFFEGLDARLRAAQVEDGLLDRAFEAGPTRSDRLRMAAAQAESRWGGVVRLAAGLLLVATAFLVFELVDRRLERDREQDAQRFSQRVRPFIPKDRGSQVVAPPRATESGAGAGALDSGHEPGGVTTEAVKPEPALPAPGSQPRPEPGRETAPGVIGEPTIADREGASEGTPTQIDTPKGPTEAELLAMQAQARERAREADRLARSFPRASDIERGPILDRLTELGGPGAITVLREVLIRRPARYGRLTDRAIEAIGLFPSEESLRILVEVARSRPIEVRASLARVTDPKLLSWLGERVLPELGERRHPDARIILVETLARNLGDPASASLIRALEETRETQARTRILSALGKLETEPARQVLLSALSDRHDEVRAAAAAALGEAGWMRAEGALLTALESDDSPPVRAAAARTIGQTFTSQESLAALERARFSDKDLSVQSQAQLALMQRSGEGLFSQTEWRTYLAQEEAAIPGASARMALLPGRVPQSYHGLPVLSEGCVFLLDISTSMGHAGKLDRAKRELERTLRGLAPGTRFNVGTFGQSVSFLFPKSLQQATPQAIDRAVAYVRSRRTLGERTDLGAALQRAIGLSRRTDQVFLLSDGAPTEGKSALELVEAVRGWTWDGHCRIHVIGLFGNEKPLRLDTGGGAPPPIQLLRDIASVSGGVFCRND